MITESCGILPLARDYDSWATAHKFKVRANDYRRRRWALKYGEGNMRITHTLYTLIFILLALAIPAAAQTFDVGGSVIRSSNPDPSPAPGGGSVFPGAYFKASFDLPKGFEAQVKVRASRTPPLQTQFTTDEGKHKPAAGLTVHPQVRYNSGRLFIAAGFEYSKQFFTDDDPGEYYSRSYNINPTVTTGVKFTDRHEASATYLLKDRDTYLYGVRANYSYTIPVSEKVSVVIGAEATRYTFRETNREGYVDRYYEDDTVLLFDIAIRFGNKKHKY